MADLAIVAEQLERSFGDDIVVNRVDLAVPRGEVFALVGPPGAGRTPLIRMLCGLLTPSGGKAKVAGFDVASQPAEVRRRVGAILAGVTLDRHDSGREALRFQGRLHGLTGSVLESRVGIALELARLDGVADQPISASDAPVQRRLELAAALLHSPQVLLLDEATVGLDASDRTAFLNDLRDIQRALSITVFLATQATAEADQIADRVAIMDRGHIVAEGTLVELKGSVGTELIALRVLGPVDDAARIGRTVSGIQDVVVNGQEITMLATNGAAVLSPLAAILAAQGVIVLELALRRSTLDDVFLELTGVRLEGLGGRATMTFPGKK